MPRSFLCRPVVAISAGCSVLALCVGAFLATRGAWDTPAGPPGEDEPPERANLNAFRERAREAGITFRMHFLPGEQGEKFKVNLYDHGCGVVVGDFDGDGHDDVYFLNQMGSNALYRNKGDGTFEDVTARAGVGVGDRVCVGATFADTLNRGLQDLYVTSTRGGNLFFRNNGDGTFTDVTEKAGLKLVAHSQTAVFFDYDNDGFLDLFVTNTARWTLDKYDRTAHYFPGTSGLWGLADAPREKNVLYRNLGNGKFKDVTKEAGLEGKGWGGDVVVFDYDNDGHLDLLVTNMFGATQLYRNNGNGTFTDVTKAVLGRTSFGAIGARAFDFNNDGRLDLLIVDMHSDMWLPEGIDPRRTAYDLKIKYPKLWGPFYGQRPETVGDEELLRRKFEFRDADVVFGNTLFKARPSGKFAEVSDKAGLETWWPWGIATGDFDNDGFEDVFLPSGMGYPYQYWPNVLMMNNGNETFTDRAAEWGTEPPRGGIHLEKKIGGKLAARSSRCAAVADFRGEGRLDLVVNNFNDRAFFFRNHFPKKNWVAFRLTGAEDGKGRKGSNRDAVGALVRLHFGKEVMLRQVQAAGGYLSQSSRSLHFGLGDRPRIDRAEVRWPGRTDWENIANPAINTLHRITEPAR